MEETRDPRLDALLTRSDWSSEELHRIASLAYGLYLQGRFDDSRTLFEGLAALLPEEAYPRRALASLSLIAGEREAAVRHFRRAIDLDPEDLPAQAAYCEALWRSGRHREARDRLLSLKKRQKGHPRIRRLEILTGSSDAGS